jgi:ribosomal protein S18 acetylase RimI-like enzyme
MEIRIAKEEQLEEILTLLAKVVKDMNSKGFFQWGEDYPTKEMFDKHIADQGLRIMVDNNVIIGFVLITEEQDKEYADVDWLDKEGKSIVIHRLAIKPEKQGKGLANRLMDYAENYAKENGFNSIRLDTYSDNKRARAFYENRGYKYRGITHFKQREKEYYCFEKIFD